MIWTIDNRLPDRVAPAAFRLDGVQVRERADPLARAIAARTEQLRARFAEPAAASEVLTPARSLYRAFGIDPSKRRPSSEALLRRAIQGKGLYTVNTAVDAANLASLNIFLPVGLYDLDSVDGEHAIVLRAGEQGEAYDGIGKGTIHLEGRPVLADAAGPFGNPSSDSFRTRVTLRTRRLLFVIFAAAATPAATLAVHRDTALRILREHVGGAEPLPR